jgi:predicted DNA-binding transcriptional regulator AlpA
VSNPSTRPPTRPKRTGSASTRHEPARPETNTGKRRNWTVAQFCAEWGITRSTFYDWRAKGRAPRCMKLPNGDLRITPAAYDAWVATCEENV